METPKVQRVVIAGGGTAGWCTAAALSKLLGKLLDITLVESADIGTVGVGEATIPTIRAFHTLIGADEREFLRESNATYKLGIAFENWARLGDRYIHAFGTIGRPNWLAPFHNVWMEARAQGYKRPLGDFCIELQASEACRYDQRENVNFAYHFDAALYGRYLRRLSEANGVRRLEGRIKNIEQNGETGFITALVLESGQRIEGDLFIDCTGFQGLLIEKTLQSGFEDWNHWLPMDRAWAVQMESTSPLLPYTRAVAHEAGWRWIIPLQNRIGTGFVYSSKHLADDAARERFLSLLEAPRLLEPWLLRFTAGRRRKVWNRNCIAIGLSSGFIEPLESTSIHLFQISVTRLLQLFPFAGFSPALENRYNEIARNEIERVRDFVIMHYKLTERSDTAFWRERQALAIPDTLSDRIELFRTAGHAYQAPDDLFRVDSWVQVMMGQRLEAQGHHHVGKLMEPDALRKGLDEMANGITQLVNSMPTHSGFLRKYIGAAGLPD